MKSVISLIGSLLILTLLSCEKRVVGKYWLNQSKVSDAFNFEKSITRSVEKIEQIAFLSESVFPKIDEFEIAQPLIFKRSNNEFLTLHTEYFFSEKDSILRYISYDWEKERYSSYQQKSQMWKIESKKLDLYVFEYEKIKSELMGELGIPSFYDEIPLEVKKKNDTPSYSDTPTYSKETIWENKRTYSKLNLIFGNQTYRIRFSHYWK
ncbi:hypothetical protein [Algoriphagus winogradskyi]|uniref:Lipoprotein n=1 Tax=Algoriphagus winogradskyi TaxID=237017 RepID=A0ABY1NNH1_9BACT|nr:hypothetical protein [Algoriphagus winogradskyi]SMP14186.1 hypothetical protein SAMN06265367_102322 [Algoriphagus winogradskyi]